MAAGPPGNPGLTPGQSGCTELANEAWLLRCILDFFRSRPEVQAVLTFVDRCLTAAPDAPGLPGSAPGGTSDHKPHTT